VTTGAENRTIFFAYDVTSDSLISLPGGQPVQEPEVREGDGTLRLTVTRSVRW
jgi:hypothetical protein